MLVLGDDRPTVDEAVQELRAAVRLYAKYDVTLALETYEQVSTADLLTIVEAVGDPHLGICLESGKRRCQAGKSSRNDRPMC